MKRRFIYSVDIKCKIVLYRARLIASKENKLSKMIYTNKVDLFHST